MKKQNSVVSDVDELNPNLFPQTQVLNQKKSFSSIKLRQPQDSKYHQSNSSKSLIHQKLKKREKN